MAKPAIRLLIAVFLVATIHAGVMLIGREYVPGEVVVPERKLSALPMQLGSWQGQQTDLDPRVFRSIGAHSVINREYTNTTGSKVVLHAVLADEYTDGVPHYPQVCYGGNGWEIVDQKDLEVEPAAGLPAGARLLTADRDEERILVLYWYQFGKNSFVDRDSYRFARREFWGKKKWPPVVKVLLQVSALPDKEQAEARLREFAALVREWTQDLQ